MTDPIYDADLLWLREGYLSETPHVEWISDPGEFALEMDASRGNSLYHKWTNRIAGDSHMDEYRRVLLPFHEAVKRLGMTPERRWLRYALNWRGLPCLCNCPRITAHLAMIDRYDEHGIVRAIRGATHAVIAKLAIFDIQRGSSTVRVGRQSVPSRIFTPTDTAPVQRTAGPGEQPEDLGVTTRGSVDPSYSQKNPPGYVCRSAGQWVADCDCPPGCLGCGIPIPRGMAHVCVRVAA